MGKPSKATRKFAKHLPEVIKKRKEYQKVKHKMEERENRQRKAALAAAAVEQNKQAKKKTRHDALADEAAEEEDHEGDEEMEGKEAKPVITRPAKLKGFFDTLKEYSDEEEEEEEVEKEENMELPEGEEDHPDEEKGRENAEDLEDDEGIKQAELEMERHKEELQELQKTDPEFYKYLQEEDPSLLKFSATGTFDETMKDAEDEDVEVEEDELEEEEEDDGDMAGAERNTNNGKGPKQVLLTREVFEELKANSDKAWALRKLLMAYKSACHISDDATATEQQEQAAAAKEEPKNKKGMKPKKAKPVNTHSYYKIPNSDVFNDVMVYCLKELKPVFELHIGKKIKPAKQEEEEEEEAEPKKNAAVVDERKEQKDLICLIKSSKKWARMVPFIKSFLINTQFFLTQLSDEKMRAFALRHLEQYVPFYAQFPGLSKHFFKDLLTLWSTGDEATRLMAFSNIHEMAITCPMPFLDLCLKGTYLTFIRASRLVNSSTLPLLTFMRNCVVELFGIEASSAYRIAFVYIRQLAVHLRDVIMSKKSEKGASDAVHNWQFIHAMSVWVEVLARYAPASDTMKHLLFPITQVIFGVIDLCPSIKHLPIRFHCAGYLIRLSEATGIFANPIPTLLQALELTDLKRKPKPMSSSSLDFSILLRIGKNDLGTRAMQESATTQIYEMMFHFLAIQSFSIAFPEVALPVVVFLRRLKKTITLATFSKQISGLLEKTIENVGYINKKREMVTFSPKEVDNVKKFLKEDKEAGKSPLMMAWTRFQQQQSKAVSLQRQTTKEKESKKKKGKKEGKGEEKEEDYIDDLMSELSAEDDGREPMPEDYEDEEFDKQAASRDKKRVHQKEDYEEEAQIFSDDEEKEQQAPPKKKRQDSFKNKKFAKGKKQ